MQFWVLILKQFNFHFLDSDTVRMSDYLRTYPTDLSHTFLEVLVQFRVLGEDVPGLLFYGEYREQS